MITTLVRRLTVGASTFYCLCLLVPGVQAQESTQVSVQNPPMPALSIPAGKEPETDSLLPLESRTFEIQESVNFETVAGDISTHRAEGDTTATKSTELDLESLPIVGDLLDEDGNFDMGLPFNVDFGDLMGEPVVIVGTDFPVR